ncbi:cupredoxin domain-containing protein [Arthrobacter sp. NPDC058288]|uniref:cupredoxin domain-containing protein n=1 Tax=Arthrobacter sp. NPDC058288 TaxID=3346424 RepID=UPI0036E001CE
MKSIQARAAVPLLAVLLLGGCAAGGGSSEKTTSPTTGATATTATGAITATAAAATITIKDFDYGAPLTVAPGAIVTVTNTDAAGHTVTADQGAAFDANIPGSGGTATFTAPSAPGSYPYHCTYHPNMHGMLIVK